MSGTGVVIERQTIRIAHLIGPKYTLVVKMHVLDWMLRNSRLYTERAGQWYMVGLNQHIFGYSANNDPSYSVPIPNRPLIRERWESSCVRHMYFDALFARAIYGTPTANVVLKWRKDERIAPDSTRVLQIPTWRGPGLTSQSEYELINGIQDMAGKPLTEKWVRPGLNKGWPHIVGASICTTGRGWYVLYRYGYSGEDHRYNYSEIVYNQGEGEPILVFLNRVNDDMTINNLKQS